MSHFVAALEAEIAELERQLAVNPLYVKLTEARRLRSMYSTKSAPTERAPSAASRPLVSGASATILDAVREYLVDRTQPTPTREIMTMLKQRGIEVRGVVPQNVVSSALSKSEDIKAIGRKGWVLRKNLADDANPTPDPSSAIVESQDDFLREPPAQGREADVPGGGT